MLINWLAFDDKDNGNLKTKQTNKKEKTAMPI